MTSLILCYALLGQVVPEGKFGPPLPPTKAQRIEAIKQKRIIEGMAAAAARKERIARDYESGAVLMRRYPAYYGNRYLLQEQMIYRQQLINYYNAMQFYYSSGQYRY